MLETVLTLLGVVLMITAVMDLGQILMFMQYFTERSRAGARYATVNAYNADTVKNFVVYNNPTGGSGPGFLGLHTSNVTVNRYDQGTPADRIEVVISNFPLRFYTPFLAGVYRPRPFRSVTPVESLGVAN